MLVSVSGKVSSAQILLRRPGANACLSARESRLSLAERSSLRAVFSSSPAIWSPRRVDKSSLRAAKSPRHGDRSSVRGARSGVQRETVAASTATGHLSSATGALMAVAKSPAHAVKSSRQAAKSSLQCSKSIQHSGKSSRSLRSHFDVAGGCVGFRNWQTGKAELLEVSLDCLTHVHLELGRGSASRHTTRKVREVG